MWRWRSSNAAIPSFVYVTMLSSSVECSISPWIDSLVDGKCSCCEPFSCCGGQFLIPACVSGSACSSCSHPQWHSPSMVCSLGMYISIACHAVFVLMANSSKTVTLCSVLTYFSFARFVGASLVGFLCLCKCCAMFLLMIGSPVDRFMFDKRVEMALSHGFVYVDTYKRINWSFDYSHFTKYGASRC